MGPNGIRPIASYEARLGWVTLLFKVIQEGKDVKGDGKRFEIILPNARFMRDPLLPASLGSRGGLCMHSAYGPWGLPVWYLMSR